MREGASVSALSVGWESAIDVLPLDRVVKRRGGYVTVRSPSNPSHYWGNFLLFDGPPGQGDASRWEALFEDAFGDEPRVLHRAFAWGGTEPTAGEARTEFVDRGYDFGESVALIASAAQLRPHPRESRQVEVRALDPAEGAQVELWDAVVELQVEGREPGFEENSYRAFTRQRLADLRALFRAGRGAWYVALDPATGKVAGSCGIVATGGRGRYQAVDTAEAFRRRGICSRLVVEAARRSAAVYGTERFVIIADRHYHALGLYESLGFERAEHHLGVCRRPAADTPGDPRRAARGSC
jgi:ribosomal protein S18 acetylase RimI-like enzyme